MKDLNSCTMEEIKELARQGQRYETMRDEYNATSETLKAMAESLIKVAQNINPLIVDRPQRKKGTWGANRKIIDDLYALMRSGTQVTRALIEKANPEMEGTTKAWVIMSKLKTLPNVSIVKDGKNTRLFYQN